MTEGMSDQSRAYLTGVTVSCGSRSTCMCSISRQKEARNSHGSMLSATHLHHRTHIMPMTQWCNTVQQMIQWCSAVQYSILHQSTYTVYCLCIWSIF